MGLEQSLQEITADEGPCERPTRRKEGPSRLSWKQEKCEGFAVEESGAEHPAYWTGTHSPCERQKEHTGRTDSDIKGKRRLKIKVFSIPKCRRPGVQMKKYPG